ncbi:hypothetical protein AX774_g856 [Zancudomyces culisetae]|uniref:Uncharacterized protein n=1 Tax=Zancudomyces culisetae TaxID=1213189 RepID=A0A1R1PXE0_ZANCU|nr:hypothetical protein AX774_g856 [Zancudomyces culisetae]|eukprot:OMH85568.1 hypothetical protein AX774_g856 [Zancudomyces culisetae]
MAVNHVPKISIPVELAPGKPILPSKGFTTGKYYIPIRIANPMYVPIDVELAVLDSEKVGAHVIKTTEIKARFVPDKVHINEYRELWEYDEDMEEDRDGLEGNHAVDFETEYQYKCQYRSGKGLTKGGLEEGVQTVIYKRCIEPQKQDVLSRSGNKVLIVLELDILKPRASIGVSVMMKYRYKKSVEIEDSSRGSGSLMDTGEDGQQQQSEQIQEQIVLQTVENSVFFDLEF